MQISGNWFRKPSTIWRKSINFWFRALGLSWNVGSGNEKQFFSKTAWRPQRTLRLRSFKHSKKEDFFKLFFWTFSFLSFRTCSRTLTSSHCHKLSLSRLNDSLILLYLTLPPYSTRLARRQIQCRFFRLFNDYEPKEMDTFQSSHSRCLKIIEKPSTPLLRVGGGVLHHHGWLQQKRVCSFTFSGNRLFFTWFLYWGFFRRKAW